MVDWSHRGEYMQRRHNVTPAEADEALADPARLVLHPDPSSISRLTDRTIGWAQSTERLITVITLGATGVNGWESNPADQRKYYTRKADQ